MGKKGTSTPFPDTLRKFIDSEIWTYAKTMPLWPHEYIVRDRVDEKLFTQLVFHIRANGYVGRFYQKNITYFDEEGMVYWTMGAPIEETIIINRCKKEQTYEYRLLNGTIPMFASFVEALMESIIETAMIPKVQIERAVGPILSMFLEDVLTETLRDDPALSGRLVMICPEFPLKKPGNSQSTNIDWLMYNSVRRQLLFVELKTSDTSIVTDQSNIYSEKQKTVRSDGGSFLIKDIEHLRDASRESGKYRYIIEKVSPFKAEIAACRDVRIVYLVPKSAEHNVKDHADRVLTFGMLSNDINGSFAEEWKVIQSRLCKLDASSRKTRNRQLHAKGDIHEK
jgi:hypothetical protein